MVASKSNADDSGSNQQKSKGRKIAKPKPKSAKTAAKKSTPTVIHADASSFRNLVQSLTRSEPEVATPPLNPTQAPIIQPETPPEPEACAKSRIQSLAPPPLRTSVVNLGAGEPKSAHAVSRPNPVRPTAPLSLSHLTGLFNVRAIPSLFSPQALVGGLLSPFTSKHALGSPGGDFIWPDVESPGQTSGDESPGAVAFRDALTEMLPPGSPDGVNSGPPQPGGMTPTGGTGPMVLESQGTVVQS